MKTALLLLILALPACTTGGYTLKVTLGYNGATAGVEYTPAARPEPPMPAEAGGKTPVLFDK